LASTSDWSEPSSSRAIERMLALCETVPKLSRNVFSLPACFALVELEANIAAKQRLALAGNTGGDGARHRIDAADGGNAKRDTGQENHEAAQATTHLT
jgi:hypothetical protein